MQTINDVVYIRCLIMGGPFDVYYMIRPENSVRGDPGDREVMRFGEKVGREEDWRVGGAVCGRVVRYRGDGLREFCAKRGVCGGCEGEGDSGTGDASVLPLGCLLKTGVMMGEWESEQESE